MNDDQKPLVLIVDDEAQMRRFVRLALSSRGLSHHRSGERRRGHPGGHGLYTGRRAVRSRTPGQGWNRGDQAASRVEQPADHRPIRVRAGRVQGCGAGGGRRRLHHQALRGVRAHRPYPRRPPPLRDDARYDDRCGQHRRRHRGRPRQTPRHEEGRRGPPDEDGVQAARHAREARRHGADVPTSSRRSVGARTLRASAARSPRGGRTLPSRSRCVRAISRGSARSRALGSTTCFDDEGTFCASTCDSVSRYGSRGLGGGKYGPSSTVDPYHTHRRPVEARSMLGFQGPPSPSGEHAILRNLQYLSLAGLDLEGGGDAIDE